MNEENRKKVDAMDARLAELHAEGVLDYSLDRDSAHFRVRSNGHVWDVWPTTDRWRRSPHTRSVTCVDLFWKDLSKHTQKSPDAQNAEPKWTPALLRLEALERRMEAVESFLRTERLEAIENFLWAEAGYAQGNPRHTFVRNPTHRIEGDSAPPPAPSTAIDVTAFDSPRAGFFQPNAAAHTGAKTVAPAPEATGRAGEGRAAIKSVEAAHAAAVRLHDYCNRNGYEGIGHSIGLLVAELERQA